MSFEKGTVIHALRCAKRIKGGVKRELPKPGCSASRLLLTILRPDAESSWRKLCQTSIQKEEEGLSRLILSTTRGPHCFAVVLLTNHRLTRSRATNLLCSCVFHARIPCYSLFPKAKPQILGRIRRFVTVLMQISLSLLLRMEIISAF